MRDRARFGLGSALLDSGVRILGCASGLERGLGFVVQRTAGRP
jgi:hypothetical protein